MKDSPLILTIKPSRTALVLMLAIHAFAVVAVASAGLNEIVQVALIALIVASVIFGLRGRGDLTMRCHADGTLEHKDGDEWAAVSLQRDSLVWPGLVVLRYRIDGRRWTMGRTIFADSLGEDDFRGFKVWLRWAGRLGSDLNQIRNGDQTIDM